MKKQNKMPENMLKWREKQPTGAIMKPETFQSIVQEAKGRGLPASNAKKEAGAAYWQAAKAKYKGSKKGG